MYTIEIFIDPDWTPASKHSQEGDRDVQYQRFIDSGILPENLRKQEN